MNERIEAAVEDSELLRRYAEQGSEAAFAELVRRRIGLVYSVALRQTRGDRHRAEDATQAVFTDLARKAHALAARPVLGGWLYRSAQFAAAGLVRAEQRRAAREQEAHTMEKDSAPDGPVADWEQLRPVLDEALNEIDERDRDAIVLRFFDGRPFAEIGARLRLTENAARMRVDRALEKLQSALARRGITSTAAAVGVVLAQQVAVAAPAGLATTVTGAALAGTTAVSGGAIAVFMGMTKLQLGALATVAVVGVAGYKIQAETNAGLRREIAAAQVAPAVVQALRADNQRLGAQAAEVEMLRGDDAELKRLDQRVGEVRQAQQARNEHVRQAQAAAVQTAYESAATAVRQEVERLNREGNVLVEEFKALQEDLRNPALAPEVRALKETAAAAKMEAIKAKRQQITAYTREAQTRLDAMPGFRAGPVSGTDLTVRRSESSRAPSR